MEQERQLLGKFTHVAQLGSQGTQIPFTETYLLSVEQIPLH